MQNNERKRLLGKQLDESAAIACGGGRASCYADCNTALLHTPPHKIFPFTVPNNGKIEKMRSIEKTFYHAGKKPQVRKDIQGIEDGENIAEEKPLEIKISITDAGASSAPPPLPINVLSSPLFPPNTHCPQQPTNALTSDYFSPSCPSSFSSSAFYTTSSNVLPSIFRPGDSTTLTPYSFVENHSLRMTESVCTVLPQTSVPTAFLTPPPPSSSSRAVSPLLFSLVVASSLSTSSPHINNHHDKEVFNKRKESSEKKNRNEVRISLFEGCYTPSTVHMGSNTRYKHNCCALVMHHLRACIRRSAGTAANFLRVMNKKTKSCACKYAPWIFISLWFIVSMLMTVYLKTIFSVHHFPYPMFLTAVHMLFTYLGVLVLRCCYSYESKKVCRKTWMKLIVFSFVFSVNIWLSNASLVAVSVRLHQVLRTTTPLFTMAVSYLFFGERYPCKILPAVILTILGVLFTLKSETSFELFGVLVVLLGVLVSAFKVILTQKSQLGSVGLNSMDLLYRVSPLATLQLLAFSFLTGEFQSILSDNSLSLMHCVDLSLVGLMAFLLNLFSFYSSAYFSPLTMNITAIVRQVITSFFDAVHMHQLTLLMPIGLTLTMAGAIWYARDIRKLKQEKKNETTKNENEEHESKQLFDRQNKAESK